MVHQKRSENKLYLFRKLNSYPRKGNAAFQTKMEEWIESMKLEFQVVKLGRHGKTKEKPGFISHPTQSDLEKKKRRLDQEEGEQKRRRKSEEDKEV